MYYLEIRDTKTCLYPCDYHGSLSKEYLPLAPARLGIRAPGSQTSPLLVSPVAGLPAQVSMCPIRVGACAAGGQGPVFTGLLFLWGGCDKQGDILSPSLRSWCLTGSERHEDGGHTVTWGKGVLGNES